MADLRRVQKTGGSTLIVSLPKRWAEATGIKSGDTLSIIPGDGDSLIIDPHPVDKRVKRVKKLTTDGSDPNHFFRRLIAVYICGYDTIEVISKEPMSTEMRASIRKFTRMVIGPEITEEDIRSVLMKDLSDSEGFGLRSVVRRIFRITFSMLKDSIDAIRDENADVSRDVVTRDEEVDRFYWLLSKQFTLMLKKPRYLQDEPNTEESLNFFLIGRILERVADHAKIISDNHVTVLENSGKNGIDTETRKLIVQAGELSQEMLTNSFDAFIKGDTLLANLTIDRTKELNVLYNDGISSISRMKPAITIPISGIFESVQRTGMYSTDIAEIAINNQEND
jgi:phosphate uptake regulator